MEGSRPRVPVLARETDQEREELRDAIRNDPTYSDAVKEAMERFWQLLDNRR